MSNSPRSVRIAVVLYRLLVRLCPSDLTQHPSEMVRDFRVALENEYRTHGWIGYFRYFIGALGDTLLTAVTGWSTVLGKELARSLRDLGRIRYTLRSLRSTWLLSATAVVTIAIAVGLTTTTFSIVYGVLIRPLPFPDPDRLMAVSLRVLEGGSGTAEFEALELRDFREWQTSFEGLEGYSGFSATITDAEGFTQRVPAAFVTAGALELLRVRPHLGRTFLAGEDFTTEIQHVVLGHAVWQERYGGADDVVGTTIRVNGRNLEVVGVMPAGFEFPFSQQLWLPMAFDLPTLERDSGHSFDVFGRLKEGVDVEAAMAEAQAVAGRISAESPRLFPPLGANVYPFAARYLPGGIAPILRMMLVAALGVMFIACANVANLLLARSLAKVREVSIRSALGASRRRIAYQFLMESLVLSVSGCLLGLGLTAMGMGAISRWLPDLSLPYWVDISLATPALGLTGGLVVLVALLAGALPAVRAARSDPAAALSDNSRGSTGRRRGGAGGTLVTAQIALSCALLIGGGLLVKSLIRLRTLDMGYDAGQVMIASISLPPSQLFELLERASSLPGVGGASLARLRPGIGYEYSWDFEVQGEAYATGTYPRASGVPIAHDYFRVMSIERLQGRDFTPEESRFGTEPALIVNETLARRHLGPDPIGRQIRIGPRDEEAPWYTVVGVVEDTYIGSTSGGMGMDETPREQMYISWGVGPGRGLAYAGGTLLVSSERDPAQLIPEVRALLREVGPTVPLYNAARLSDVIEDSTWVFGLFGTVFAVFGGVALLMSVVGLYGVIAFGVNERRPEMSVRMAMGADANSIMRLVLGEAGRRLLWGAALGLVLSVFLGQGIRAALFGVGAVDLTVYTTILGTVVGTGLLAAYLPAHRAARADPVSSLGG